jgi:hypothetical protein
MVVVCLDKFDLEARCAHPESPGGVRSRIWVTSERDASGEILGSFIPPSAHEDAHAVLHVHVVPAAAVGGVRAAIALRNIRLSHRTFLFR